MTYEQFFYWLSGYVSGMGHGECPDQLVDILTKEIKKVRPAISGYMSVNGCT